MVDGVRRRAAHLVAASLVAYACGGSDDTTTASTGATSSGNAGTGGATGKAGSGADGGAAAGTAGAAGAKSGSAGVGGASAGVAGASSGSAGSGGASSGSAGVAGATSGNAGVAGASSGSAGSGGASSGNAGVAGATSGNGGAGSGGAQGGTAGGGGVGVVSCGKPTVCGASACGNGVIDTCMQCSDPFGGLAGGGPPPPPPPQGPGGSGQCTTVSESCDGANVGTVTCASLGFTGGNVSCTSSCELDTSGCDTCAAGLAACGTPSFATSSKVVDVALASDGVTASIAWVDAAGAHFAHLDDQLAAVSLTGAFGATGAQSVAVATLGSGDGLVAVHAAGTITIFRTNNGAATEVHQVTGLYPVLAARPAGPLLVYVGANSMLMSEVLGPGGEPGTAAKPVFQATEPQYANAAFNGTRFVLAERGNSGASVVTIDVDGTVGTPVSPGGSDTEYPEVASNGKTSRMTYNNFSNPPATGVYAISIDDAGLPTSQPLALGVLPAQFNVAPLVQRGSKSVVLLGGYTGMTGVGKTLDLAGFDPPTPQTSTPIARGPWLSNYRIANRANDVVVAWLGRSSCSTKLWLARAAQ